MIRRAYHGSTRRSTGCLGCLIWSASFWPLAGFIAWPLLAWHGAAGWAAAGAWWAALAAGLVALALASRPHSRR